MDRRKEDSLPKVVMQRGACVELGLCRFQGRAKETCDTGWPMKLRGLWSATRSTSTKTRPMRAQRKQSREEGRNVRIEDPMADLEQQRKSDRTRLDIPFDAGCDRCQRGRGCTGCATEIAKCFNALKACWLTEQAVQQSRNE